MRDDTTHWRDSARVPKFYFLDAYACFPLVIFLLHIRLWTFTLAIASTLFFWALSNFGFTMPVFLRWLRCQLAGRIRASRPWWTHRRED